MPRVASVHAAATLLVKAKEREVGFATFPTDLDEKPLFLHAAWHISVSSPV